MKKHNIIKLHILKGISWFMLSMPIIVIFFSRPWIKFDANNATAGSIFSFCCNL